MGQHTNGVYVTRTNMVTILDPGALIKAPVRRISPTQTLATLLELLAMLQPITHHHKFTFTTKILRHRTTIATSAPTETHSTAPNHRKMREGELQNDFAKHTM